MTRAAETTGVPRVVVVGGGLAGSTVARGLRDAARRGIVEVHLVDPVGVRVQHGRLGKVVAGAASVHTAVDDLERLLPHTRHHRARALGADVTTRTVTTGEGTELAWDHLVLTLGATTEDLGVPGVREHALGFRTPADALRLGTRIRRRTGSGVVVVGGGHAGVTAAGGAAGLVRPVVLVDRKPRILTAHDPRLGAVVADDLRDAGVELALGVPVTQVTADGVLLRDGTRIGAGAVVWAAGGRAPTEIETGFPGEKTTGGRLVTDPMLAVRGTVNVWACGDAASVPDLERGGDCPQSALHAVGQARRLTHNLLVALGAAGTDARRGAYRTAGTTIVVATGAERAAGLVRGHRVTGTIARVAQGVTGATTRRRTGHRGMRIGRGTRAPVGIDPHVPLETPRPRPAATAVTLGTGPRDAQPER